jgi:hypothetical protein
MYNTMYSSSMYYLNNMCNNNVLIITRNVYNKEEHCTCKNATLVRVFGCFRGKVINITYSECMFEALSIQHAMRMHHFVICVLPDSQNILPYILQTA